MGLPELIGAFERDTETQLAAIRHAAEADVHAIEAEAARLRAERIASAAAEAATERRAQGDAEIANALHRARADVYARRAAMLQRLRIEIETQLGALVDAALADALVRVAVSCAGDEPGTLHCNSSVALRARTMAPASLRIAVDESIATGVIVELAGGTRIDATLARLLDREWPRLSGEAVRLVAQEAP